MASHARVRFEDATRRMLRRANDYHGLHGRTHLATIVAVGPPVVAELHDSNIELEEGQNLVLSQTVREYRVAHGLAVDDNLAVALLGEGDWHATAVFSDTDVGDA